MAKIDAFLKLTLEQNASDLHLAVGSPPVLRLFGELRKVNFRELDADLNKKLIYEILTPEQQKAFEERNDLDFPYTAEGLARFRCNVLRQRKGIDITFRAIPDRIPTIEELGFPETVKKMCDQHQGIVLVTGPSGCGKTTSLAAMMNYINQNRRLHIITIEDPVEYIHPCLKSIVNQRSVGYHTQSFTRALRAALREDPDVILVGEMRDLETMQLAITAAETGHLVFGTLMTASAHKTIDRVIDSFPANQQSQVRTMLSESLRAVIYQQLLLRADGKGRIAALELLVGTAPLRSLIREAKTYQIPSMMQIGIKEGMIVMDAAIVNLLRAGKITEEEAYRRLENPKLFEQFMQKTKGDG